MGKHELPDSVAHAIDRLDPKQQKKMRARLFEAGGRVQLSENGTIVKCFDPKQAAPEIPPGHKLITVEGMHGKGSGQPGWRERAIVDKTNAGKSGTIMRGIVKTEHQPKRKLPIVIDANLVFERETKYAQACHSVLKLIMEKRVITYLSSSIVGEWNSVSARPELQYARDRMLGIYAQALFREPRSNDHYVLNDPMDDKYVNLLAEVLKIHNGIGVLLSLDYDVTEVPNRHPFFRGRILHPTNFFEKYPNL